MFRPHRSTAVVVPQRFVIRLVLSTIVALVLLASLHSFFFSSSSNNNNNGSTVKSRTTIKLSKIDQLRQQSRQQQDDFCHDLLMLLEANKSSNIHVNSTSTNITASTITRDMGKSRKVTVHGFNNTKITYDMYVYEGSDFVSDQIVASGEWDSGKVGLFVSAVESYSAQHHIPLANLTFVDIGANIGWFTFQMASLGVKVIAVEPMQFNVQLMRQTMCLNPQWADRITLLQTGLSSYNHSCVLYSDDNNVGDGNMNCNVPDPSEFVPPPGYHIQAIIPSQRIDDLLFLDGGDDGDHHRPLHIAAVKMDVEAHEPQVVLGGLRFFGKSGIPLFVVEFIPKMIESTKGDAVGMLQTFCQANCTIRRESALTPWSCTTEALDPATWKDESIMDLIIECPSNNKKDWTTSTSSSLELLSSNK